MKFIIPNIPGRIAPTTYHLRIPGAWLPAEPLRIADADVVRKGTGPRPWNPTIDRFFHQIYMPIYRYYRYANRGCPSLTCLIPAKY